MSRKRKSNGRKDEGDAVQSDGPGDPLQVLAEDRSGLSATPPIAWEHAWASQGMRGEWVCQNCGMKGGEGTAPWSPFHCYRPSPPTQAPQP